MPLSSTCRNCGQSKTPDYYAESYCKACTDAVASSRELALKNDQDPGAAKREALGIRAHNAHNNHIDPRVPMNRGDYWNGEYERRFGQSALPS